MKTITIKQPWTNLILAGIKDIKNMTWPTKFRGKVLVHAAQKPIEYESLGNILTEKQWGSLNKNYDQFTFLNCGVILGSVEIVDCVVNHPSVWAEKTDWNNGLTLDFFPCEEVKPIYNWVLVNPILFPEPIPAKGKLSFWDYPNILAEPEENDGELFCHCKLPVDEKIQVYGDTRFGYYCRYCGSKWYK